jgi:hypothetical protein
MDCGSRLGNAKAEGPDIPFQSGIVDRQCFCDQGAAFKFMKTQGGSPKIRREHLLGSTSPARFNRSITSTSVVPVCEIVRTVDSI